MDSRLTRRRFLASSVAGAASLAVPGGIVLPASAQPRARKLVIVLAAGGWDTTYVFDPKPGSADVDTPPGEIQERGGVSFLSHESRPAVDAFFERWGSMASVVNGLQVRSFVHPDCYKRVLTGGPSEVTPDVGAIVAHELGRALPVPYLALGSQARSGQFASITGRTGTTNQLASLVNPLMSYPGTEGGFLPRPGFRPNDREAGWVDGYLRAGARRLRRERGELGYNADRIEDFLGSLDRAERLRAFASEGRGLGDRDYTRSPEVQVPLVARALREELSQVVMLQTDGWDTHESNAEQANLFEELFGLLDQLGQALEADSLLDDTLVLVLSEMGRTPKLNQEAGKDHWPVTSAMLFGAGVRGGQVLGGTSEQQDALPVDLATGQVESEGLQLQPYNLLAGVLEHLGVDPRAYLPGAEPFRGFMAG